MSRFVGNVDKSPRENAWRARDKWLEDIAADPTLPPASVRVALVLALHLNVTSGRCDPSIAGITSRCGLKCTRTTERAVKMLAEAGWITRDGSRGRRRTNYSLVDRPTGDAISVATPEHREKTPAHAPGFEDRNPDEVAGVGNANPGELIHATPANQYTQPRPGGRTNTKENTEENKEREDIPALSGHSEGAFKGADHPMEAVFEDFWSACPKQQNKEGTFEEFQTAVRDGADPKLIVSGMRQYRKDVAGRAPEFIASPLNWLRRKRWNEAPADAAGTTIDMNSAGAILSIERTGSPRPSSIVGMMTHHLTREGM